MKHGVNLSRRTFLKVGGTAAGAAILAACAPVAAPADDGSMGEGAMAEPVTIRYGRHDPAAGVALTLESFQEEYPDIVVSVEQIGEFHAKIPALAAAGTLPDVVRSWEAMALDMGRNNQFIDVQPYVDGEPGFNAEDFYENWWNYPVVEGKRYGVPDAAAPHVTFYNADLFDEAGVEYPNKDSFTWTDYEEKARAISDPDNKIWGRRRFRLAGTCSASSRLGRTTAASTARISLSPGLIKRRRSKRFSIGRTCFSTAT